MENEASVLGGGYCVEVCRAAGALELQVTGRNRQFEVKLDISDWSVEGDPESGTGVGWIQEILCGKRWIGAKIIYPERTTGWRCETCQKRTRANIGHNVEQWGRLAEDQLWRFEAVGDSLGIAEGAE